MLNTACGAPCHVVRTGRLQGPAPHVLPRLFRRAVRARRHVVSGACGAWAASQAARSSPSCAPRMFCQACPRGPELQPCPWASAGGSAAHGAPASLPNAVTHWPQRSCVLCVRRSVASVHVRTQSLTSGCSRVQQQHNPDALPDATSDVMSRSSSLQSTNCSARDASRARPSHVPGAGGRRSDSVQLRSLRLLCALCASLAPLACLVVVLAAGATACAPRTTPSCSAAC